MFGPDICGGGYLKIMPAGQDQAAFTGDSDYNIMFGPDICGYSTKKIHVIFNYKGKNLLVKKEPTAETDQLSHVYTLLVKPDNTYEVFVDGDSKQKGSLEEDWDFLEPRKIKDPEVSKPDDWVDDAKMEDPEDVKPEGWDDIPKQIDDPEAEKPEDWDDEADGEWEPPMIDNPEYKGEWKAKRIDNPDYEGPWVHPEIDIWQVKAGSIFDNIFLGDSLEEAQEFMKETYTKNKDAEKKMFDKAEEERRAKEEEEEERREAEEEEDEEDEDEDEEEEEEATPEKE